MDILWGEWGEWQHFRIDIVFFSNFNKFILGISSLYGDFYSFGVYFNLIVCNLCEL